MHFLRGPFRDAITKVIQCEHRGTSWNISAEKSRRPVLSPGPSCLVVSVHWFSWHDLGSDWTEDTVPYFTGHVSCRHCVPVNSCLFRLLRVWHDIKGTDFGETGVSWRIIWNCMLKYRNSAWWKHCYFTETQHFSLSYANKSRTRRYLLLINIARNKMKWSLCLSKSRGIEVGITNG
jgi:hypothetical protein